MAISKLLLPIMMSLPLVISTTIYSTSNPNSITTTHNVLSSVDTNNQLSTDNSKTSYFISVTPGEKYVYERKVTIVWGWGDEVIPIYGHITNFPLNKTALVNRSVIILAAQNNQTIYESVVRTDIGGFFNSSFVPPMNGIIQIRAELLGQDLQGIISVVVTEPALPLIFISVFIAGASTLTTYVWYRQRKPVPQNQARVKRRARINALLTIFGIILTIIAYVLIYKYPPFDAAGNAAIATGLIIPIIGLLYDTLKTPLPDPPQQHG